MRGPIQYFGLWSVALKREKLNYDWLLNNTSVYRKKLSVKGSSLHSEPHIMFYLCSFRVNIEQQNLARSKPTKCPPWVSQWPYINFNIVWLERHWRLHSDLGATSSGVYITCRIREGDFSAYSHMRTSRFMSFLTTATELHLFIWLSFYVWGHA